MKSSEIGNQHINQFNSIFNNNILNNIISETPAFEFLGFKLTFCHIEIHKPFLSNIDSFASTEKRLFPSVCRERSMTYSGACFLKMRLTYNGRTIINEYRPAGQFPIMVRSSLCSLYSHEDLPSVGEDPDESGGYFIVSGNEKLLRFTIAYKQNHMFVISQKKTSQHSGIFCMIRSVGPGNIGQRNEIRYTHDGNVQVKIFVRKKIYLVPAVIILRALANTTDEEIYGALGRSKRIYQMLAKMGVHNAFSQTEAMEYIGRRFMIVFKMSDPIACAESVLRRFVLPHLDSLEDKYNLILHSIRKLFRCIDGEISPDDIDLTSNHELYTEAHLIPLCVSEKLEEIKRQLGVRLSVAFRNRVPVNDSSTSMNVSEIAELGGDCSEEQIERVRKIVLGLDINIGNKVTKLVSLGVTTTNTCSDILQANGFALLAERINYWRFLSHFESVTRGTFFTTTRVTSIRMLRPESWGFLCPIHTPDGPSCGVLLHLARKCVVLDDPSEIPSEVFYEYGVSPVSRGETGGVMVLSNGQIIGTTDVPEMVVSSLRRYRERHSLRVEIVYESSSKEILTYSRVGMMMRPIRNLSTGMTELVGPKEQVFLDVRLSAGNGYQANGYPTNMYPTFSEIRNDRIYEYEEIDNNDIFSSVAGCITFAEYNPSPRNIYQCQMAKQAMGIASYNRKKRSENKTYEVSYLQSPMVETKNYHTFKKYPIGFNCIVAVISYTAYDMEDAVIINKAAQERGLFNGFVYKNEHHEIERDAEIRYIPSVGSTISPNGLLISYFSDTAGEKKVRYGGSDTGRVDDVRVFSNSTNICVTLTIRVLRNPTIGDKFCSRHGQKGVCSYLWADTDMPFTEYGLRPDIIINPHAFPSRMTIGMMLESIAGKVSLCTGEKKDATPFERKSVFEEMGKELVENGFNYYGNEPMYSGTTGGEMKMDIFIGNVYYQRLRHMVNDKFQVRTSGAIVATTHQPVGGRKNRGGIRFGEMEKDALIAHGSSYLLKDRLMDCSDKMEFLYCGGCRSVLFTEKSGCICGKRVLKKIELPYVFKYLCCELLGMNVRVLVEI